MNHLLLENISLDIDNQTILSSISLDIHQQHGVWSILGTNGSGKSSLLKLVAGLYRPTNGKVMLNGALLNKPTEQLIPGYPGIVYFDQLAPLLPKHDIKENLLYRLRQFPKQEGLRRMQLLVDIFHLDKLLHKLPQECSGGERQRAALACALCQPAAVVLFDEPFNNLDYEQESHLRAVIHQLQQWGESLIALVTHRTDDLLTFSGQTTMLHQGKLLQHGPTASLMQGPTNALASQLLGYHNSLSVSWLSAFLPEWCEKLPVTGDAATAYCTAMDVSAIPADDGIFMLQYSYYRHQVKLGVFAHHSGEMITAVCTSDMHSAQKAHLVLHHGL